MKVARRAFCLSLFMLVFLLNLQVGEAFKDPFNFSWEGKTRSLERDGTVSADIFFDIPKGHFLYKHKTSIAFIEGEGVTLEGVRYPKAELKKDPFSGKELEIYRGPALTTVKLKAKSDAPLGKQKIRLKLLYQGCSPKLCFRQKSKIIEIPIVILRTGEVRPSSWSEGDGLGGRLKDALHAQGWLAYLLAFIGGVLTDFTPCVIPLIPLTLAVIGIRREKRKKRNFLLTSVLVLAMAVTYAFMGVGVSLLGFQLGFLFQNPIFLFLSAVLFLVFALGLFGAYELQVPLWLRNRMAKAGGKGYAGAAVSGVTMGLLAAPCVGPVIGALLVWVAQTRDVIYGFGLLFSFGLGMGSLILVVGTFYGSLAGRIHGGRASLWVQRAMGVLLLVPALYYGYIAYAGLKVTTGRPASHKSESFWMTDYSAALARSTKERKAIVIDFYADWCLPCLEWGKRTFSHDRVRDRLEQDFIPLKIDCTKNTPMCQEAVDRYTIIGWPTVLMTDHTGQVIEGSRLVGQVLGPEEFLAYLRRFVP